MLYLSKQPQRGDKISYQKEIMFKGVEVVTATIVGVLRGTLLFDNGDSALYFVN